MTVLPGQSCESWGNRATLGSRGPGSEEDLGGAARKPPSAGVLAWRGRSDQCTGLGFVFCVLGRQRGAR